MRQTVRRSPFLADGAAAELPPPLAVWARSQEAANDAAPPRERTVRRTGEASRARRSRPLVSTRQACFAFGLRNLSPVDRSADGGTGDRLARGASQEAPNAPLVKMLEAATPQECLDAAFGLQPPREGGGDPGRSRRAPFTDEDYYRAIARWLGCAFDDGRRISAIKVAPITVRQHPEGTLVQFANGARRLTVIAPAARWLPRLAAKLCAEPHLREGLCVTTPRVLQAILDNPGPSVMNGRITPLHVVPKTQTADLVLEPAQGAAIATIIASVAAFALVAPQTAFAALSIAMTLVLFAYAATRGAALVFRGPAGLPRQPLGDDELPVYTILIPLYRETGTLDELVCALLSLDYPRDKIDIQFLVEADDTATLEALKVAARPLTCRICIIPDGRPRTKPRALNAGLRQARGTIVAVYDAEDRPDPMQLRIAAETFAAAPPELAAVQARLTIDHVRDNWIAKMFAIEYACQFDRLLPTMTARGRMFLLGGTSNHFRVEALLAVGGWDPFNVTEDADLAIRLRRNAFRLGVIDSDTFEEAPVTAKAWIKQRSRWFKGYMQTWLVHNRRPLAFIREVGLFDALLTHLLIIGALTAALAHNLMLVLLALWAFGVVPMFGGQGTVLITAQVVACLISYGCNFALGAVSIAARGEMAVRPSAVVWLPFYWVLMGLAALLAIHDLMRRPHHWRKTTHGVAERPAQARRAKGAGNTAAGWEAA